MSLSTQHPVAVPQEVIDRLKTISSGSLTTELFRRGLRQCFLVGLKAEESGVLRFGSMALRAIQKAQIPVFTVQVRRSYGLGGVATGNANPLSLRLIWPSAMWGDMPMDGGLDVAFKSELEAVPPEQRAALREQLAKRFEAQSSIWGAVENFQVEEMIDPRDTRRYLARLVRLAYCKPLSGPAA